MPEVKPHLVMPESRETRSASDYVSHLSGISAPKAPPLNPLYNPIITRQRIPATAAASIASPAPNPMPQTHRQALPQDYMLQEYQLGRVLGAGGFGLTYLGWDTVLDKPVAVKEYLPNDLAVRAADNSVVAKSGGDEGNFRWGLNRFLDEARTLAKFKHPNIVSVYRYFEAHGTAYIVMEFVEGETLHAYLKRTGKPKESFLRALITALLDGLAEVHRAGAPSPAKRRRMRRSEFSMMHSPRRPMPAATTTRPNSCAPSMRRWRLTVKSDCRVWMLCEKRYNKTIYAKKSGRMARWRPVDM